MIKAVILDFDGTLVDFVEADLASLRQLHEHAGVPVGLDEFTETAVEAIMRFHALVDERQKDPLLMHSFRLKQTFVHYGLPWKDEYVDFYRTCLMRVCRPFEGVVGLLQSLRGRVKIGLLTNAYDGVEQRARIDQAGLTGLFDALVVSGEVGLFKPDPAVFLHVLNLLDVPAQQAVFVGDSIPYDIAGARSAGMQTILFSRGPARETSLADYSVGGIAGLRELLNVLLPITMSGISTVYPPKVDE